MKGWLAPTSIFLGGGIKMPGGNPYEEKKYIENPVIIVHLVIALDPSNLIALQSNYPSKDLLQICQEYEFYDPSA